MLVLIRERRCSQPPFLPDGYNTSLECSQILTTRVELFPVISIDIAWLAHSAQPDSLEDKCLIFLRQVGVGAARRLRTRLGNSSSGCRLCWCRMLPVAALRICDSKQPFEFSGCLIAACEGVPTVPGLVWA